MTTDLPTGLPPEPGAPQLRWLIERVAAGEVPVDTLIAHFRPLHEKWSTLAAQPTAPRTRRG